MTGAQALDLLMGRLNRGNAALRAKMLTEMIFYQQMRERDADLPDWLYAYDQNVVLTAANRVFAMPTGFIRLEDEDDSVWILDDNLEYQRMMRVGFDDPEFERTETGALPLKYAMKATNGYTFPTPTVDRTIKVNCFVADTTIADNSSTNGWLTNAADLIIGGTGVIVTATYIKDPAAAAFFAAMETAAKLRMGTDQTAHDEAGRNRSMGGDD